MDASGKQVLNATLINGRFDVSKLTSGAYTVTITKDKTIMVRRFTK
ncbi:MAG: T9SS type A sorting domain-containing protein [Flavobacteriales bacterium]|nr:T9SS type A sorting domain-containing protein [Flavobacteriales bacterium]